MRPMKIYERPMNLFVAGFLGNPAMNQFRGRVRDDGAASRGRAPCCRSRRHKRCAIVKSWLGVRPEDIQRIDAPQVPHSTRLAATVELVEAIGNEAFIHARYGAWPLIVRSSPYNTPAVGAQITLHIAPERMHFFDAQSGARLLG